MRPDFPDDGAAFPLHAPYIFGPSVSAGQFLFSLWEVFSFPFFLTRVVFRRALHPADTCPKLIVLSLLPPNFLDRLTLRWSYQASVPVSRYSAFYYPSEEIPSFILYECPVP